MVTHLLKLPLRTKRDIMAARQRARQLAGLLGFDRTMQTAIAAAIFEVACQAWRSARRASLEFQLTEDALQVVAIPGGSRGKTSPIPQPSWNPAGTRRLLQHLGLAGVPKQADVQFHQPLPPGPAPIARDDLPWMIRELTRLTPLDLFEEIQQQNREFLTLWQEGGARRATPASRRRADRPAA